MPAGSPPSLSLPYSALDNTQVDELASLSSLGFGIATSNSEATELFHTLDSLVKDWALSPCWLRNGYRRADGNNRRVVKGKTRAGPTMAHKRALCVMFAGETSGDYRRSPLTVSDEPVACGACLSATRVIQAAQPGTKLILPTAHFSAAAGGRNQHSDNISRRRSQWLLFKLASSKNSGTRLRRKMVLTDSALMRCRAIAREEYA